MIYVRFGVSAEQTESILLCRFDVYDNNKGIATEQYWYFMRIFPSIYDKSAIGV